MKRNLNKILDDYIIKSDYRELIIEIEEIIKDFPETIIRLIDLLNNRKVETDWKRNQIKDRFLSFLFKLEEDDQIKISYEVVRKYLEQINIKELADKLCFFVSWDKLLNQIIETREEQRLKEFNQHLINELLLRGKLFNENEKKIIIDSFLDFDFDFNWVGLDLSEVEIGLPLRSYTLNGGSLGISFGLQSEEKFLYSILDFSSLKLNKNTKQALNDLSSTIAKEYIRLIEIGNFEYSEEEHDIEAGIICQLNYEENLSESTGAILFCTQ